MLNSPHDLISRDDLIGQFVEQMRYDNATVFLGAGMSVDCGMPSWAELIQPIFKKFNIDISKSDAFLKYDFYDLAEKYLIFNSTRTTLNNMLYDEFSLLLFSLRGFSFNISPVVFKKLSFLHKCFTLELKPSAA